MEDDVHTVFVKLGDSPYQSFGFCWQPHVPFQSWSQVESFASDERAWQTSASWGQLMLLPMHSECPSHVDLHEHD